MSGIEKAFAPEHRGRRTVKRDLVTVHEAEWKSLVDFSLFVHARGPVHYDNFKVSAVLGAYDSEGNAKQLSGANYTPTAEAFPRRCAEMGILRSYVPGDILGGVLLLRAPDRKKEIQHSREMSYLQPCGPCRPVLEMVSRELVIATFLEDSREPVSAVYLGDVIDYQNYVSDVEPVTPPQYASPLEFAVASLGNHFIPADPQRLHHVAHEVKSN